MLAIIYRADDSQGENSGSIQGELVFFRSVSGNTIVITGNVRSLGSPDAVEKFNDAYSLLAQHLKIYESYHIIKKIFDVYARSEIDYLSGTLLTSHS